MQFSLVKSRWRVCFQNLWISSARFKRKHAGFRVLLLQLMAAIATTKNHSPGLTRALSSQGGVSSERVTFSSTPEIEFNVVSFVEDWAEEDEGRSTVEQLALFLPVKKETWGISSSLWWVLFTCNNNKKKTVKAYNCILLRENLLIFRMCYSEHIYS